MLRLVLVFVLAALGLVASSNDDLISVAVLFRHGDRAPTGIYKNDPYDESYWPLGFGQLTNVGKNQHYALGQYFRERYADFLPQKYNRSDITVRSSNVDRCLMSATTNLAGLYGPVDDEIWNQDLLWQPIPVHTTPESEDALLAQDRPCQKYDKLYEELMNSDFIHAIESNYTELFEYLTENTGEEVTDLLTVMGLYDILYIESLNNLTLPEWTKTVFPAPMETIGIFSWTTFTYTSQLARLKAGPLIDHITSHLENAAAKVDGTPKLLMLSAHDSTIASLLNSLQVYDYEWPHYASSVIFELRGDETNQYVNLFYRNPSDIVSLQLPRCDLDCDLNSFTNIVDSVRVSLEDWELACQIEE